MGGISHDRSATTPNATMTDSPIKHRSAWIKRHSLTGINLLSRIPSHSWTGRARQGSLDSDGKEEVESLEGGFGRPSSPSDASSSSSSLLSSPVMMSNAFPRAMVPPGSRSISKPLLSLLSMLAGVLLTVTYMSSMQARGEGGFTIQPAANWTATAETSNLTVEVMPTVAESVKASVQAAIVAVPVKAPMEPKSSCESQRQVHVVIPATSSSGAFCRTLATMSLNEYKPVILNWGGAQAHSAKIFTMDQYLRQSTSATRELEEHGQEGALCGPDERQDIVLMTDAYDVWAQEPLDTLISKFLASNKRIIFSADKGCFPNSDACQRVPESTWPSDAYGASTDVGVGPEHNFPTHTRPRWLNSGFVVGFAKDLALLYQDAAEEARRLEAGPGLLYDQAVFQPLFASNRYNVSLDYSFDLVQPYFWNEGDLFYAPLSQPPSNLSSRLLDGRTPWMIHNRMTHSRPSMVHFQFWKKPMDVEWPRMWWGGQAGRAVAERVNAFLWSQGGARLPDGRWMGWQELCGQPGRWDMADPRKTQEERREFQIANARYHLDKKDKEPMPGGLHFAPPFPSEEVVDKIPLEVLLPPLPPKEPVQAAVQAPGEMLIAKPVVPAEAEGQVQRPSRGGQKKLQRVQKPRPIVH